MFGDDPEALHLEWHGELRTGARIDTGREIDPQSRRA
jgi:hypothetical protein